MHRDQVSPASRLLASEAASPPCRPVLVCRWRYIVDAWRWRLICIAIAGVSGGFAACRPGTGLPVGYGRCIEIRSHLHRDCWHQWRLRRLVVQYWCAGGAILWIHRDGGSSASLLRASAAASPPCPVLVYQWLWQMHRDRVSPASLLLASEAASPPCRPVQVCQLAMADA